MLIFKWLSLAQSVAEYKGILAHAALHGKLCPTSTLTFCKMFEIHPVDDALLLPMLVEQWPAPSYYRQGIKPVTVRESESGTPYRIENQGDTQEIPMLGGDWDGFGTNTIVVRRYVSG